MELSPKLFLTKLEEFKVYVEGVLSSECLQAEGEQRAVLDKLRRDIRAWGTKAVVACKANTRAFMAAFCDELEPHIEQIRAQNYDHFGTMTAASLGITDEQFKDYECLFRLWKGNTLPKDTKDESVSRFAARRDPPLTTVSALYERVQGTSVIDNKKRGQVVFYGRAL